MDFRKNMTKGKIDVLMSEILLPLKALFSVTEKINQENVNTIEIEIDSKNSIGLVIIYEDGYMFFNYLNKNDNTMINQNWSKKVLSLEDLLKNLSHFLIDKIA